MKESSLVVLALQLVSLAVCMLGSSASEHPLALTGSGSAADGLQRLYVVSVDGVVSALDWEGHPVWSYQLAQPLFSSTLNYKQLSVMADDIIDQSFPYGESAALAGAKFREVETLDTFTGQLVYQCSASKCYQSEEQSVPPQWMQLLKASSYRVTVRLAQEMTGEEMWNFTVGEVELSLVGSAPWAGEEGDVGGAEYGGSVSVKVDTARGVLYGEGEGEMGRWNRKMSAPITSLWVQDGLRLIRVNLSSHSVLPSYQRPSLMMVHYKEKFYIQPMPLPHNSQSPNLYSPISYTLLGAVEAMAATRWGRDRERMRVEEEEVEEDKFELALYRNSDLFKLCSEHSEGTSVYFMAEEISEGSCQLPRDENGSEDSCGAPSSPPTISSTGGELVEFCSAEGHECGEIPDVWSVHHCAGQTPPEVRPEENLILHVFRDLCNTMRTYSVSLESLIFGYMIVLVGC
ncbi:hypothetical protein GBAR_LOCUS14386 [Geodia barretti]|uniref:Uncharacterized protein n=1 Tax=Geodia barretti TaxID=519541 RepID=A0AA35WKI9_GEOBA|nr:hypothetical protein GBAR_LOCUS14386 [Geodia barretti]